MDIIKAPTLSQIQAAVEWLSRCPHQNPDLEYVLNLVLTGRLQDQGELLAIAVCATKSFVHSASTPQSLASNDICGVLIASPGNKNVSLVGGDLPTAEALLSIVQARGCPQRVAASSPTRNWIRPQLLRDYQLKQEHNPLIMLCTEVPVGGNGRWAVPEDKPALQASFAANQAEQGIRTTVQPNWETLIQQKRVAVLEHDGQIVSVMRRGATAHHGLVLGALTVAPFRRQGFAKQLLAFMTRELLQNYPAVKLWVDEDNWGAIALYKSLGFQPIDTFYTCHFKDCT